jgi:hypothetical protein
MHTHAINGQHLAKHVSLPQWIQELQGVVNAGHDGDEESSQESDGKKLEVRSLGIADSLEFEG